MNSYPHRSFEDEATVKAIELEWSTPASRADGGAGQWTHAHRTVVRRQARKISRALWANPVTTPSTSDAARREQQMQNEV
jgi:hypothetical protein